MSVHVLQLIGAIVAALGTGVWASATWARWRGSQRILADEPSSDAAAMARASIRQHLHAVLLWLVVFVVAVVRGLTASATDMTGTWVAIVALIPPAWITVIQARRGSEDGRLFLTRLRLDQRAQEVIAQESEVTAKWTDRLVPAFMEEVDDLEFGRASHAGAGLVTGDFLDVVPLGHGRCALVIGDATGHGVDASISAFQSKYVLRSYLRRFRDPAQVLDELNEHLGASSGPEDLLSVLVAIVDTEQGTLRYASAGHCTNLALVERELVILRSTGPLLMLDRNAHYASREVAFGTEDLLLLYSDGLVEARNSSNAQFGTERIGQHLRREATSAAEVLAKSLLDSAVDHASGQLNDDLTVLAVRRK